MYLRTCPFILTGCTGQVCTTARVGPERTDLCGITRAYFSTTRPDGPVSALDLRDGVLSPDISDPGLDPVYRDVLGRYGVVALPSCAGEIDRRGK